MMLMMLARSACIISIIGARFFNWSVVGGSGKGEHARVRSSLVACVRWG